MRYDSKVEINDLYPMFVGAAYFLVTLSLSFSFRDGVYRAYPEAILLFALLPLISIFLVVFENKNGIGKKLKKIGLTLNVLNAMGMLVFYSIIG